jgi:hypothetical protein
MLALLMIGHHLSISVGASGWAQRYSALMFATLMIGHHFDPLRTSMRAMKHRDLRPFRQRLYLE